MSQEDVEVVRGAFQVLAAEGMDAALASFAPGCVWYTSDRFPDAPVFHGHDGMRRLRGAFTEIFDDWHFEVDDIRDAQDRVVALIHMVGEIRGSASSVSQPMGLVVDVRGAEIADVRAFASWAEALEAAGLSE
jgi:ketosteroid isomerase-like protein